MRIYGGLKPEDWRRWGAFTVFKSNAPSLLARQLRPEQRIYCSPLVDPYQPAEAEQRLMPAILEAVLAAPPRVFAIQTRAPLILRDLDLLYALASRCTLRVSFSVTTDREDVRRLYEPRCAPYEERLNAIRALRAAGIETYATLAPLLPCHPESLALAAIDASGRDLIGDPLHVRATKPQGATTHDAAFRIARIRGHETWFDPAFQAQTVERIQAAARARGRTFATGPAGFSMLAA